jgi:serine/threonine protein kinase
MIPENKDRNKTCHVDYVFSWLSIPSFPRKRGMEKGQGALPPFHRGRELTDRFWTDSKAYTFIAAGSSGCVFRGPFEKASSQSFVIKIIEYSKDDSGSTQKSTPELRRAAAIHEGVVGAFVSRGLLPAGSTTWVQTAAFGEHHSDTAPFEPFYTCAKQASGDSAAAAAARLESGRFIVLVQEDAGTTDLQRVMADPASQAFGVEDVRRIMFQLCWAVHVAGAEFGFVHGDIKPANVAATRVHADTQARYAILRADGKWDVYEVPLPAGSWKVRLIDLGGSFLQNKPTASFSAVEAQTLPAESPYWAPASGTDVFWGPDWGSGIFSVASDLFALGTTLTVLCAHGEQLLRRGNKTAEFRSENDHVLPLSFPPTDDESAYQAITYELMHEFGNLTGKANAKEMKQVDKLKRLCGKGALVEYSLGQLIARKCGDAGFSLCQDLMRYEKKERLTFRLWGAPKGANYALWHVFHARYYKGVKTDAQRGAVDAEYVGHGPRGGNIGPVCESADRASELAARVANVTESLRRAIGEPTAPDAGPGYGSVSSEVIVQQFYRMRKVLENAAENGVSKGQLDEDVLNEVLDIMQQFIDTARADAEFLEKVTTKIYPVVRDVDALEKAMQAAKRIRDESQRAAEILRVETTYVRKFEETKVIVYDGTVHAKGAVVDADLPGYHIQTEGGAVRIFYIHLIQHIGFMAAAAAEVSKALLTSFSLKRLDNAVVAACLLLYLEENVDVRAVVAEFLQASGLRALGLLVRGAADAADIGLLERDMAHVAALLDQDDLLPEQEHDLVAQLGNLETRIAVISAGNADDDDEDVSE